MIRETVRIEIEVGLDDALTLQAWSALVRLRAGCRCEDCTGEQPFNKLIAHHLSYKANTLRNGKCLCRSCHAKIHFRTPEYRNKMSAVHRARPSESYPRGWKQSEETRLRRCAAQQARRQKEKVK